MPDWLGAGWENSATGPFGSPLDNDPLPNIGERGLRRDIDYTVPPVPTNFKARILYPGPVVELSAQPTPYGIYNQFGGKSPGNLQTLRFYITPMRIEQIAGGIAPSQYNALFSRAQVIDQIIAPPSGSLVTVDVDFNTTGVGVYWATQFSRMSQLESPPAGPIALMTSDYQDALDKIPPDICSIVSATITASAGAGPRYSTLKYVDVTIVFNPPANTSHFFGVIPLWKDYFSNFITIGSSLIYGGVIPWDGASPSTITFRMEADYNSTGSGFFTISHTVVLYLLSVNASYLYQTPYTGQLAISFTPGIGN